VKSYFPARVDAFPLSMTIEERNAVESTTECTIVDLMFMVRELQKYCLELAAAVSVVQTSGTGSETTVNVTSLAGQISTLQAQIAALPEHLEGVGEPLPYLGKNGDTYWDMSPNGLMEWVKLEGTWRQRA